MRVTRSAAVNLNPEAITQAVLRHLRWMEIPDLPSDDGKLCVTYNLFSECHDDDAELGGVTVEWTIDEVAR